jgi:hypothetical protein
VKAVLVRVGRKTSTHAELAGGGKPIDSNKIERHPVGRGLAPLRRATRQPCPCMGTFRDLLSFSPATMVADRGEPASWPVTEGRKTPPYMILKPIMGDFCEGNITDFMLAVITIHVSP